MRKFWVLLKKEVRELITLQMLLPFAITIVMFIAIGNLVGAQGEEAQRVQEVVVVDLDNSAASAALVGVLEQSGFDSIPADLADGNELIDELKSQDLSLGLIIPNGFGDGIASGSVQEVETYSIIKGFSAIASVDSEMLAAVLRAANEGMSTQLIAAAAPESDPLALKEPVTFTQHVVLGDAQAEARVSEVFGLITQQTTFIPIILFLVIIFSAQMIATTVASEKENKTLETLLASPVSRAALITAKMVAAALVALLSAAAYMVGLNYYMRGIMEGLGGGPDTSMGAGLAEKLGIALVAGDWVLMGLALFTSILVALSIAVILGAFAENVKAVQSLLTPLMLLVMIPYFLTIFIDLEQVGAVVKWFVLAIPFTHAFTAAPNLFLGNYGIVVAGIVYQFIWFVVLVAIAARIFASDRILTMKLNLKRKQR